MEQPSYIVPLPPAPGVTRPPRGASQGLSGLGARGAQGGAGAGSRPGGRRVAGCFWGPQPRQEPGREAGRAGTARELSGGRSCNRRPAGGLRPRAGNLAGRAERGTPCLAASAPGRAARARRDQQHEQRLQQPGGLRGLLLHRQDLLLREGAPGQASAPASK